MMRHPRQKRLPPLLILLTVMLGLLAQGCAARHQTVTNLPPGVTQQQVQAWDSAVANLHAIAISVSSLRQAVTGLNAATYVNEKGETEKIIPDGRVYGTLLLYIGKLDQTESDAADFLEKVPKTWSPDTKTKIAAWANAILATADQATVQGLDGIKDPKSQAIVQNLLADIRSVANLLLGSTK